MNLKLTGGPNSVQEPAAGADEVTKPGVLTQTNIPPGHSSNRAGVSTHQFKGKKSPDYALFDAANRKLGLAGERLVVEHERKVLIAAGHKDLAAKVRHVADLEGDGAGYDVLSFKPDGKQKFIEVKTTRGNAATDFHVSRNELAFSEAHADDYVLYRVFNYDPIQNRGEFYVADGSLNKNGFSLVAVQYRVVR